MNDEDEHRCTRCGRRLRPSVARPAHDAYPISTATAPSLAGLYEAVSRQQATAAAPVLEAVPSGRAAYQRGLFPEAQRVVEMPMMAAPAAPPRQVREQAPPRQQRSRRTVEGQQRLDLDALDTQVEALIYCDVPVALPAHRAMATALDISMVLIGLGIFLLTFHIAGGEIVLSKQTIPYFAGAGAILALFYHFLYSISGGDTAGMRWTQLRLVNFDGMAPNREQRLYRMIGGCLSFVAAGLGLIWALVDEESLTWHDHISKTFPSPDQAQ